MLSRDGQILQFDNYIEMVNGGWSMVNDPTGLI